MPCMHRAPPRHTSGAAGLCSLSLAFLQLFSGVGAAAGSHHRQRAEGTPTLGSRAAKRQARSQPEHLGAGEKRWSRMHLLTVILLNAQSVCVIAASSCQFA